MTPITIALCDDHRVVTTSLTAYLHSFADMRIVGAAKSGEELLAAIGGWQPQVVLLDMLMPGGIDGIETAKRLRASAPAARVIALTASMDEDRMIGVLREGAAGYVRKDADPEVLLAAIRAVAAGGTFVDPAALKKGARRVGRGGDLTPRERDVLAQLARGAINRDIATALNISEETVKSHVTAVLGKLQVDNRAQAVVAALRLGLVSDEPPFR